MAQLNTARGAIDTADLGVTLMHEHVFVLSPEIVQNYPEVWGEEARREADAIRRLNELKAPGVDSIVGLTVIGLGRYIPRIARIAAATELNIVVATGVYTYNDVPMHFHFTGPGTVLDGPEPMTELFVRDIEEGIAGTGVKAAILKCATDEPGVTPGVERVLRAVAQAHRCADLDAHPRRDAARTRSAAGPTSGWTASVPTRSCRSRTGWTPWFACANAGTPARWSCRTMRPASSTGCPRSWCPSRCRIGISCISTMTCRRCGSAGSPMTRSAPCWSTTRAGSFIPGAATDVTAPVPPMSPHDRGLRRVGDGAVQRRHRPFLAKFPAPQGHSARRLHQRVAYRRDRETEDQGEHQHDWQVAGEREPSDD